MNFLELYKMTGNDVKSALWNSNGQLYKKLDAIRDLLDIAICQNWKNEPDHIITSIYY